MTKEEEAGVKLARMLIGFCRNNIDQFRSGKTFAEIIESGDFIPANQSGIGIIGEIQRDQAANA